MELELLSEIEILYNRKKNIMDLLDLINGNKIIDNNPVKQPKKIYLHFPVDFDIALYVKLFPLLNKNKGIIFKYAKVFKQNEINMYVDCINSAFQDEVTIEKKLNESEEFKKYYNHNDRNQLSMIALIPSKENFPLQNVKNLNLDIFKINFDKNSRPLTLYENQPDYERLINYILAQNKHAQIIK